MPELVLYDDYSREDVHQSSRLTQPLRRKQALGDFKVSSRYRIVLATLSSVNFGQTQGEHVFDEGITEEGVLTWQSQPQQDLNDKRIEQSIRRNEFENSLLFCSRGPVLAGNIPISVSLSI